MDVHQKSFELVLVLDDEVKRILPRYEQVAAVNSSQFLFAIETSSEAFSEKETSVKKSENQITVREDVPMSQLENSVPTHNWQENKGAHELSKKLKPGYIQVILNI